MKIFVSGATGFIGSKLVMALAEKNHIVHALYRSEKKALRIQHKNIKLFKGDITDSGSLEKAIESCDQVYQVAAFAQAWAKDNSLIYRLNVDAAMTVIDCSIRMNVKKIVITSTAGVLGASSGEAINESSFPKSHFSDYENSKALLEKKILALDTGKTEIVMVNPSRVYGPGILSQSNSVTSMIDQYMKGIWRIIPGSGNSIGNYVFIDDVVKGHMLAMEHGRHKERYILGGENISYNDFFSILAEKRGKVLKMIKIPLYVMLFIARTMMFLSKFGIKPGLTPAHVKKFILNFELDITKASEELHYNPLTFTEGAEKTIQWLKNKGNE